VEKWLWTVVNKGYKYIYFFISLKFLSFFIFYLPGGKSFQPAFVQIPSTSKFTWNTFCVKQCIHKNTGLWMSPNLIWNTFRYDTYLNKQTWN
jgi:hypothetical protein